jgi:ABC-type dipeptide/oligopeptide/nickel transport system ATPase component
VADLRITFGASETAVEAVRGVSFSLQPGEVRAVVGESGSGKSVTALSLAGLLPKPPSCTVKGQIRFEGRALDERSRRELRQLRGKEIAYIFQEPSASLNPVYRIGAQLRETLRLHRPEVRDRQKEAIAALERVGIREPSKRIHAYPGELSGGMLQRVMIAMALLAKPRLLVADEPTASLDVTIERQIIDLLREIQAETGMAMLLITHNFGIIGGFAETVQVMWRGKIVETGPTEQILSTPQHPYTRGLIECIPRLGQKRERLPTLEGLTEETSPDSA